VCWRIIPTLTYTESTHKMLHTSANIKIGLWRLKKGQSPTNGLVEPNKERKTGVFVLSGVHFLQCSKYRVMSESLDFLTVSSNNLNNWKAQRFGNWVCFRNCVFASYLELRTIGQSPQTQWKWVLWTIVRTFYILIGLCVSVCHPYVSYFLLIFICGIFLMCFRVFFFLCSCNVYLSFLVPYTWLYNICWMYWYRLQIKWEI
jgi:hypothetical protein